MYWETFDNLCKDNHVSYAEVARQTDISKATISAWKKGEYTPKADKLQRISAYFRVPMDYFFSVKAINQIRSDAEDEKQKLFALIEKIDPKRYENIKRYVEFELLEESKENDNRKNQ